MSTIQAANISDGTDTVGTTYVVSGVTKQSTNYNQSTLVVNSSVNTSSITDVATGQPEPQFTNNFADKHYITSGTIESTSTAGADRPMCVIDYNNDKTTDGCQYMCTSNSAVLDFTTSSNIQGVLA